MKKLVHRSIGLVLALTLILAQILIPMPMPANAAEQTYSVSAQSAADRDVQDGVTLHCWNWSYKNIEANMAKIASLGYTAVQTSPIQPVKQTTAGSQTYDWWVFYQPVDFCIDNTGKNALGTKAEFESMCATAHEYGIKVIVDVVANHMADYNGSGKHPNIADYIENDSSCWHDLNTNISNYNDRYNITQYCLDGVPDLNTASDKVQSYVLNYLKECIDAGADGFRFDAVKHIETPEDTWCASDFWPTVINGAESYASSTRGIDLYCYGELLYHPDDNNPSSLPDSAYTKYFSVTDNSWSNNVRNNISNASAYSYSYHKDATADQLVLWAESHDTYAGNENSDNVSNTNINKTWALVASRADAMALYLARPDSYTQTLGTASVTAWSWSEVAAVNHFHNAFVGQSEYISNENGIAYVERGTSGVVLVNSNGSNSVNVTANVMADGTYTDQVSGNTFTVSGGRITGTIGSTGIAVVYNAVQCDHESHSTSGICTSCGVNVGHSYDASGVCACGAVKPVDTKIYFVNSNNWSTVYIYYWSDSNTTMTIWPGDIMTKVEGTLYSATIPGDATKVIFHNNTDESASNKTADLTIQGNHYTMATGAWTDYSTCTHSWGTGTVTKEATCTTAGVLTYTCANCGEVKTESIAAIGHSYDNGQVTTSATCTTNGVKTYTCANCSGTKTESISATGHSYVNGICSRCGAAQVVQGLDYYLIGYINGENHGDGDDYANLGDYSFKNGPITTTFTDDTYVCVKNAANTTWYMTDGYQGQVTSVTLYNTSELGDDADKLYIPVGVEVTITLVENSDGTLTLSYALNGEICGHDSHNTSGKCTDCGVDVGHTYVNGICSCGATEPVVTMPDYYLFGWINNMNYACEENSAEMGEYKLVNGTLTTTFSSDAYVAVKTADNSGWYMTNGWLGTDVTSAVLYNTSVTGENSNKLYVPGGVKITFTLVDNGDDSFTLSYTEYVEGCSHSWKDATCTEAKTCTLCGETEGNALGHSYNAVVTAPTCTENGYTTHTCSVCGDTYTDSAVSASGHSYDEGVVTTDPTCTTSGVKTFTCSCGDSYTEAVASPGHSYNAVVTAPTCVAAGYTTHTCSVCGESYTDSETAATGIHTYVDGTCTGCGAVEVVPTVKMSSVSLALKDEVKFTGYFTIENIDASTATMGLMTYESLPTDVSVDTADHVIPGATYQSSKDRYIGYSQGIPAKEMGDLFYICAYVQLEDGTYVYSDVVEYSVEKYAYAMLDYTNDADLQKLLIAMLNYGAEAQLYFGYNTDDLVNADLTDEQKNSLNSYSADLMDAIVTADSSKTGNFVYTEAAFSTKSVNVTAGGALALSYRFNPAYTMDGDMTMYYWDAATYNNVSELTVENATGSATMTVVNGAYQASVTGIAAKDIDKTIYAVGVYESDGVTYTTGIIAYNLNTYFGVLPTLSPDCQGVCEAAVVYCDYAKLYFLGE